MKLSFMTLGCPAWNLDTICARGREYGFDGVDFRGYLDTVDVTTLPMFSTHAAQTRRQLNDAGLKVSCISSSIRVCAPDAHQENLDEAKRTIVFKRSLSTGFAGIDNELFYKDSNQMFFGDAKDTLQDLSQAISEMD